MTVMTSRERVLRAVNFQDTDRVPIDLGAMKASGIGVKVYNRIKKKAGIHSRTRIWDPKFMIASVEEAVMRRFHLDVVPLDVSSAVSDMPRKSPFQIDLSDEEATELNRRATKYTLPYFEVVRAKMILMAAAGIGNDEIAVRLNTRREVVSQWRQRFFKERLAGLQERARPGRPRVFPPRAHG